MTSAITPSNVDGDYPIAGQDNDSQGFRDNFTNIKNNFTSAASEITDLQSKAVLTAALTGESLDNDGGGALLHDFEVRDFSETRIAKGSTSGTVTFDYSAGGYQTVTSSGSLTFAFTNFSASGKYSRLRVEVTISNVAHTVTLPAAVTIGDTDLQGYAPSTNIITFDTTGTYIFEFGTHDAGTTVSVQDLTRSRTLIDNRTPVNTGQSGDIAGMMVQDGSYVYVCTGTYDGSTVIWSRATLSAY